MGEWTIAMTATYTTNINSTATKQLTQNDYPLLTDQFVDMVFITRFTGLTDKWFYKLIQDGKFPKPIKFGRSSRWLKSEVETWVQERIYESRSM